MAAESPEQALSLLEEHLKDDPGIVLESREGNIRLCVRGDGGIMDSGMRAEKPGVLFPFYEERFPTYKVFTDVF